MLGIAAAVYFVLAPPGAVAGESFLVAREGERILRWRAAGAAEVRDGRLLLARFAGAATVVADFQDAGFLRLTMTPNVADNAVVYAQGAQEIFVNGRKVSCRAEGEMRRLFYPNLQNREPCEK